MYTCELIPAYLRLSVWFRLFVFALIFTPSLASAMAKAQYDQVRSFCQSKAEQGAGNTESFDGTGAWVWSNGGYSHKACDNREPTSLTGWCEMRWNSCVGGVANDCYSLGQYSGFSSAITGTWKLTYTGASCPQLTVSASGCTSPDNAGICDQIVAARGVADTAMSVASSAATEVNSMNNSIDALPSNLDIGLGQYNVYTNSFWSYSQIVDDMRMWTKWGVEIDIANWNQQKAMMQTQLQQGDAYLAALEQVKQAVLTGGSTEINLTDVTNALANQTDQDYLLGSVRNQSLNTANALASSLNDKADDSNDTAIEIKNVLQGMATKTTTNGQTVNTGLELLHNDAINQQNIQDQMSDQLGGLSNDMFTIKSSLQQIANNTANPPASPPVNVNTSAMEGLQAGTNARIDGLANQIAGVNNGIASLNSSASSIASNTGAVADSMAGVSQSTINSGTADLQSSINSSAANVANGFNNASSDLLSGAGAANSQVAGLLSQMRTYVMPTIQTTGGCTLPPIVFMGQAVELSLCEYMDMFRYLGMMLFFFANMRSIMIILDWVRASK